MTPQVTDRIPALDRLRGLIIVLMVLDHASYFVARVHPLETWASQPPYYADWASFLTRWLTHLCAPGFFMLMGMGIVYLGVGRMAAGWTGAQVTRFLATRGLVLLMVQHVVENPAWLLGVLSVDPAVAARMPGLPGVGGETMLALGVLSALGVALIVGSVVWRVPVMTLMALAGAALWATRVMTPSPSAAADPIPVWQVLTVTPGLAGIMQNLYPWVPWLVPMLFGIVLAREVMPAGRRMAARAVLLGVLGLVMFVVARVMSTAAAGPMGVMEWLTVTKYPPSTEFLTLMMGVNLLMLAALARWPVRWLAPLEVYGRAPFFVYLAHLWVLGVVSWAFPQGATFPVMYLVWLGVVGALYPACRWYARFKSSKPPTSLWRLL